MIGSRGGPYRRVRCRRSTCDYCARLNAQEDARVITLDAQESPPSAVLLLTTRDPAHHGVAFTESMEQVFRALRRRWPAVEYLAFIEFTTGEAPSSRGARRMHAHVLLKGIPTEALARAQAVASRVWGERMDAPCVTCEPIGSVPALVNYLAHHHRKPGQEPPPWWRGRRTRASRGYYHRPAAELRAEAKAQLADERRHRAARRELGEAATPEALEAHVAAAEAEVWAVVRVRESPTGVVTPLGLGASPRSALPPEGGAAPTAGTAKGLPRRHRPPVGPARWLGRVLWMQRATHQVLAVTRGPPPFGWSAAMRCGVQALRIDHANKCVYLEIPPYPVADCPECGLQAGEAPDPRVS